MRLQGSDFIPVLESLVNAHGDSFVSFVTLEPTPQYYRDNYGYFAALRIERDVIGRFYWDGVSFEPNGDPSGAINSSAKLVAITGTSGRWAVWGNWDWDIVLVYTKEPSGLTGRMSTPLVGFDQAIDSFARPQFWLTDTPEEQFAAFRENVEKFGGGTRSH